MVAAASRWSGKFRTAPPSEVRASLRRPQAAPLPLTHDYSLGQVLDFVGVLEVEAVVAADRGAVIDVRVPGMLLEVLRFFPPPQDT